MNTPGILFGKFFVKDNLWTLEGFKHLF
jgi:hypothetical protein